MDRRRGGERLGEDWLERWSSLSHGERQRAQLGVLLWREPLVLGLDESTNHLDAEGRDLLLAALRGFEGVGLLVSHDRELLDGLCERCLFLDPPDAVLRPGGYSDGVREAGRENAGRARAKSTRSASAFPRGGPRVMFSRACPRGSSSSGGGASSTRSSFSDRTTAWPSLGRTAAARALWSGESSARWVFLRRLTGTRWRVEAMGDAGGDYELREEDWSADLGRRSRSRLL